MKRLGMVALVALMLAACQGADPSTSSAAPPATPASNAAPAIKPVPSTVGDAQGLARYDGYGDMRFGMDEAAFGKAWSGELKGAPEPGSTCFYKTPVWATSARDFAFMFDDGQFVRYDVGTAKEAAPGGAKVGMDEAQIRALYGARVEAQPHKYVDGAHYLRVAAPTGDGVLLFETDEHGKVTRWRVGVPPQIDYVEGCS